MKKSYFERIAIPWRMIYPQRESSKHLLVHLCIKTYTSALYLDHQCFGGNTISNHIEIWNIHFYSLPGCLLCNSCWPTGPPFTNMVWPADRIRLFVHYTISLSSLCELICRHWTYGMPSRYILSSVWVRLIIFWIYWVYIVIHYPIYGAVCFQFTQFPRDGWEDILLCLIIIIKSEVWTIIHCSGLGHETMVCTVCLIIFLFLWFNFNPSIDK